MTTFGTMVSRIARELRRDGITADIKDAIVTAIDAHKGHRFWFNEKITEVTASASANSIAMPSGYIAIDRIEVTGTSTTTYDATRASYEELKDRSLGNTTFSEPDLYAIYDDLLFLYPPPDQGYVLRVSGVKELTEVSASASDAATNSWMTEGEEMIRQYAKSIVFNDRMRNPGMSDRSRALADSARARVKARSAFRATTGRVRKSQF